MSGQGSTVVMRLPRAQPNCNPGGYVGTEADNVVYGANNVTWGADNLVWSG